MKKILLVGMLVIGSLSFGRDYEARERQELKAVETVKVFDSNMMPRERLLYEENYDKYSDFHKELDNMSRGSDNKS